MEEGEEELTASKKKGVNGDIFVYPLTSTQSFFYRKGNEIKKTTKHSKKKGTWPTFVVIHSRVWKPMVTLCNGTYQGHYSITALVEP